MTHFKKYLSYRLRSTSFRTVVIAVICTVFVCVYIIDKDKTANRGYDAFAWMTLLLAAVIPMLETYHLKDARTLDVVFSFPVRKREIALAHYLSGAIQLALVSLAMAAVTFFIILIIGPADLHAWYVIPMYFSVLIFSLCVYSFVIFVFGEGNTTGDGVMFAFGFYGAVRLMLYMLDFLIDAQMYTNYFLQKLFGISNIAEFFSVFTHMNRIIVIFESLIEAQSISPSEPVKTVSALFKSLAEFKMLYPLIISAVIWLAIGVACTLAYLRRFERYRAERAGDISDSPFGYCFIIPALGFTLMNLSSFSSILINVFILVAMLIGYFIYRRSFRIKLFDLIVTALSLVFIFI